MPLLHGGICSQLIQSNTNELRKLIWSYAPFAQTPTNGLRRHIFGNVGNKQPGNVILFCDRRAFVESQRQTPS